MFCIFCKKSSENSKSIEHIIPESLGNDRHVLKKGIVCDKCNNYFAIKIEQPLLSLRYFVSLRHRNSIENKKGNIPTDRGILLSPVLSSVNLHRDEEGYSISFDDENIIAFLMKKNNFSMLVSVNEEPPKDNILISKLLGKIGLEALAKIGEDIEGGIQELIDKVELDPIRNYVRYGIGLQYWPYHCRKIYSESEIFIDTNMKEEYQILHEYKFLYTVHHQLLVVVVLFGFEYCLDMTQPSVETYLEWLKENNNVSPLEKI